jgi:methylated-DNA-[protein]-cysteine S-methyltransferase
MTRNTDNRFLEVPSPIGRLTLEAQDGLLVAVCFEARNDHTAAEPLGELAIAELQLAEYFSGERRSFELPLAEPGAPFDREVLSVVNEIPYGDRTSYGQVTATLGLGRDQVRKVAAAIGRNPLPIIVPCHRVVGADGSLTGYGGGLERKAKLLTLESGQLALAAPEAATR